MKKLTSLDSLVLINHYKNILEGEGIACEIRNEHLGGVLGEMPFTEVWPQLWIRNDLDFDRAKQLIEAAKNDDVPGEAWTCSGCGESNEGQFAACWKCSRPFDAEK